jgi:hypothetical protein
MNIIIKSIQINITVILGRTVSITLPALQTPVIFLAFATFYCGIYYAARITWSQE